MDLNWPATGLILGLVGILAFRLPLARLLERTERVKDWIVAPKQPSLPASSDVALPTPDRSQEQHGFEELTRGFNSQLLMIQEASIRQDLANHGFTVESGCEKVLLRHLAGTQIALQFAKLYGSLYGSQLRALRWLNAQAGDARERDLAVFFDQAAKEWPGIYKHTDFRSWLGFLAGQGLVTESAESAAAGDDAESFGLAITVTGREFLAYLVNAGRPDLLVG